MSDLTAIGRKNNATVIPETALSAFRAAQRGPTLTAQDPDYDSVRQIWNGMHDKRPALIVRCAGVADVIAAVNFAREYDLLVAVRGGGHNVGGTGSCEGGVMIDLSLMRGVHVDTKARTARVQGGCTWGDVDRETQVFGLAAPGGLVSTTGVAGLTLGGGMGFLRRKHGLSIDNILSVEIVTADGAIRVASAHENPELFWGVRGGGGNFGVVTSFEFSLHPVGPMVTFCNPWYSADDAAKVLAGFAAIMKSAPDEFSAHPAFWTIPAAPLFPEEHHGKRAIMIGGVHTGPLEEASRYIQPLRELAQPLADLSGPLPWTVAQSAFDPFVPKGIRRYYFKSRYLKDLDDKTIAALLPRAIRVPDPSILVVLWNHGGAMQRVSNEATAYRGREHSYMLSVDCIWDDPAKDVEVIAYARAFLADMEPYSPGGLYVNFAGMGEEGEKLVKEAYGPNYSRLVALKNKYDPTNLFHLNQNIRPTA